MNFSERLAAAMRDRKISTRKLSELTGIPKSAIQRYTSGQTDKIPIDRMQLMAEAMGVDPASVMGWSTTADTSLPSNLIPINQLHRQRVPVIGHVAAGVPIMAEQEYEACVESPVECDAALIVDGDSMAPTYLRGDLVYIRQQPDVHDGQVAVVLIDDSATMKHVYHTPTGLLLVSDNPAYPPMDIRGDEHDYLSIFGLVVGYTRMLR